MNSNILKQTLLAIGLLAGITTAHSQTKTAAKKYNAYLFTYFTGNGPGEEAIRFAISMDGYHYRALNDNKPVIDPKLTSSTGGVRDPHILRGADGKTFYMVATDMQVAKNGWGPNPAMVLMKSTDLINWSSAVVPGPTLYPEFAGVNRVWAPQTIYDVKKKKYMLYWSMRTGQGKDKIYYAYANPGFTGLETTPKQLFFSPDSAACIDGDIEYQNGKYHLFFKTEDRLPGIKKAVSDELTQGYKMVSDQYLQQTSSPVEGAGTFKLNNSNTWILMYDMYTSGKYQFTKSTDLEHFTAIDGEVAMNFHPRHGTVMAITNAEANALVKKWMQADDVIGSAQSPVIKKLNLALDTAKHQLYLPVKPGTQLNAFNPQFVAFPGVTIQPKTVQNFTNGPVKYTISVSGKAPVTYEVSVKDDHNPLLDGYYADPEILYAEKTKRYYIYPTSDGFNGWSGTYFKAFSSPDLVNWKDEGKILQLGKDVTWAKTNAWAPCIVEKKIDGQYKYFYYFCAAQKIGVAVADDPAGPFKDSGQPLISTRPEGVTGGQTIDADVFTDPKTGKSYLYWGNGFMAAAELNDDMVSLKPGTTKIITPDKTFREGTYVFFRNNRYYFMWSQDDTRSPKYCVRYGYSDTPDGKITIPENNLVITKDEANGIYGTGHNSVVQIPGRDEWYLVYHRFNYPNGIHMGQAAGFNREVCIDKMEFNADGSVKQVIPTLKGIDAVK